jgi:multiple sugar transport system permease protein
MADQAPGSRPWIAYLVIGVGVLWTLVPLYLMFITAFKSWHEMHARPLTLIPQDWTLWGFQQAWAQGSKGIVDSAIIAAGTVMVSLLLGVPAAYSFSRFNTGGRSFPFLLLVFRFLPPIALSLAIYLIAVKLGVIDSHLLLILANSLFNVPFAAWIMKGFFDEIPYAIEEAAQMDGASWPRAMRDHVLPLVVPGLVAVALFVAVFTWNELVFATILTADDVVPFTRVVPGLWVGRKYLLQPNWPAISALGLMNVVAVLLLAFYLQRYIVRAMSYGAVSGATWE